MQNIIAVGVDCHIQNKNKVTLEIRQRTKCVVNHGESRMGSIRALKQAWITAGKLSHTKVRSPSIQDQNSGPLYMCISTRLPFTVPTLKTSAKLFSSILAPQNCLKAFNQTTSARTKTAKSIKSKIKSSKQLKQSELLFSEVALIRSSGRSERLFIQGNQNHKGWSSELCTVIITRPYQKP